MRQKKPQRRISHKTKYLAIFSRHSNDLPGDRAGTEWERQAGTGTTRITDLRSSGCGGFACPVQVAHLIVEPENTWEKESHHANRVAHDGVSNNPENRLGVMCSTERCLHYVQCPKALEGAHTEPLGGGCGESVSGHTT